MSGLHRLAASVWLAAALLMSARCVQAFEPAVISVEDLFAPAAFAVVLGRFEASNAEPANFIVEETLRGDIPPGRYALFESGPFGSTGQIVVYGVSRPLPDVAGRVLLPVIEVDAAAKRLIAPMATVWRFRVDRGQVRDLMGFSTGFEALAQAVRGHGQMPAWKAVKR